MRPSIAYPFMFVALLLSACVSDPQALVRDQVCFYDEADFYGDRFCTTHSIRNLADENWNDAISSLEVRGDFEVTLYENADFRGRSMHYAGDASRIRGRLYNNASSLKIVSHGGYSWDARTINEAVRSNTYHYGRESSENYQVLNKEQSNGWILQPYCNCRTGKRCYVKGHQVGQCIYQCPSGCKG